MQSWSLPLQHAPKPSTFDETQTPYSVCVINLDRSTERLQQTAAELAAAGLDFIRIPGLLATDLPATLRRYMADPVSARRSDPLTAGEIGCFAAHLSICERMVLGTLGSTTLVLEDDCLLPRDLAQVLAAILEVVPPSWDLVRLANQPKRAYLPVAVARSGHMLVRYSSIPNYTSAYLLSLSGARKLLRDGPKPYPFDEYLRRPWLHGCETYGVWPAPVQIRASPSDIDQLEARSPSGRLSIGKAVRRADLRNLPRRALYNVNALGLRPWLACAAINAADRVLKRFGTITLLHRGSAWLGNPGRGSPET